MSLDYGLGTMTTTTYDSNENSLLCLILVGSVFRSSIKIVSLSGDMQGV